jgi:glycosyltransferase involved in cell wall biosynthesis
MDNKNIVIISTADWDNPFWTNKQHMAVQFAKNGWKVLYIDSLGLRAPTANKSDLKRIFRRILKAFRPPVQVRDGIWRVSPINIPLHRYSLIRKINTFYLKSYLFLCRKALSMKDSVFWTYNPVAHSLASSAYSKVVYHCVDDLSSAPGIDSETILAAEKELSKICDVCFVTSLPLKEKMSATFRNVIYDPNVCDVEHFSKAQSETLAEPEDLKTIPYPRLLFIGAISEYKLDFHLIKEVAKKRSDLHFVLIGKIGEGQPESKFTADLPNIHLVGPKAYPILPSYLQHSSLCLIPSVKNQYTAAMFPMKFFEYLAAGKQVIARNIESLDEFKPLFFSYDSPETFESQINAVLTGEQKDPALISEQCRFHSWEARFSRMVESL